MYDIPGYGLFNAFTASVYDTRSRKQIWTQNRKINQNSDIPACEMNEVYYRLWSSSKMATSWAAARAYEQGMFGEPSNKKEGMKKKVSEYVNNFHKMGDYAKDVTLENLLTHSNGLPRIGWMGAENNYHQELGTYIETVACAEYKLLPNFVPGVNTHYGYGISMMGRVLEVVYRKPLAHILDELIFDPLEMNQTGFYIPESERDKIMTNPSCFNYPPDAKLCMGGEMLWGTIGDYAKLAVGIANGTTEYNEILWKPETIKLWTSPVHHICDELGTMGLGCQHLSHSSGRHGMTGMNGTSCKIDPRNHKVYMFFTQTPEHSHAGEEVTKLTNEFKDYNKNG